MDEGVRGNPRIRIASRMLIVKEKPANITAALPVNVYESISRLFGASRLDAFEGYGNLFACKPGG